MAGSARVLMKVERRGFLSENFRQSFRDLLSIGSSSRQNSGARRSRQDEVVARHGGAGGSVVSNNDRELGVRG